MPLTGHPFKGEGDKRDKKEGGLLLWMQKLRGKGMRKGLLLKILWGVKIGNLKKTKGAPVLHIFI